MSVQSILLVFALSISSSVISGVITFGDAILFYLALHMIQAFFPYWFTGMPMVDYRKDQSTPLQSIEYVVLFKWGVMMLSVRAFFFNFYMAHLVWNEIRWDIIKRIAPFASVGSIVGAYTLTHFGASTTLPYFFGFTFGSFATIMIGLRIYRNVWVVPGSDAAKQRVTVIVHTTDLHLPIKDQGRVITTLPIENAETAHLAERINVLQAQRALAGASPNGDAAAAWNDQDVAELASASTTHDGVAKPIPQVIAFEQDVPEPPSSYAMFNAAVEPVGSPLKHPHNVVSFDPVTGQYTNMNFPMQLIVTDPAEVAGVVAANGATPPMSRALKQLEKFDHEGEGEEEEEEYEAEGEEEEEENEDKQGQSVNDDKNLDEVSTNNKNKKTLQKGEKNNNKDVQPPQRQDSDFSIAVNNNNNNNNTLSPTNKNNSNGLVAPPPSTRLTFVTPTPMSNIEGKTNVAPQGSYPHILVTPGVRSSKKTKLVSKRVNPATHATLIGSLVTHQDVLDQQMQSLIHMENKEDIEKQLQRIEQQQKLVGSTATAEAMTTKHGSGYSSNSLENSNTLGASAVAATVPKTGKISKKKMPLPILTANPVLSSNNNTTTSADGEIAEMMQRIGGSVDSLGAAAGYLPQDSAIRVDSRHSSVNITNDVDDPNLPPPPPLTSHQASQEPLTIWGIPNAKKDIARAPDSFFWNSLLGIGSHHHRSLHHEGYAAGAIDNCEPAPEQLEQMKAQPAVLDYDAIKLNDHVYMARVKKYLTFIAPVGGFFGGLCGIASAPVVSVVVFLQFPKTLARGTVPLIFFSVFVPRGFYTYFAGEIDLGSTYMECTAMVLGGFAGLKIGDKLAGKLTSDQFILVVTCVLLMAALTLGNVSTTVLVVVMALEILYCWWDFSRVEQDTTLPTPKPKKEAIAGKDKEKSENPTIVISQKENDSK